MPSWVGTAMICTVQEALLNKYKSAATEYNEAVARMSQFRGMEFERAWEHAESVRGIRKRAYRDLLAHEREHGCASDSALRTTVATRIDPAHFA
jgi:hypothetical protein